MPTVYRKIFTGETEEELLNMTRDEACLELMEKERRFCEYYVRNFNIKMAATKAGYSAKSAHISGWKLRQKPEINRYIAWLKLRVSKECHIDATDIVDKYIRIAFADITDFVVIEKGRLKLVDGVEVDGQLITKIKQGRDGISIELADKMRALEKLEHYFDVMPKDWRQKIEERKLELMEQKLDLERQKAGINNNEEDDDGFIEALTSTAEEVWEDDED